jgi:hypothetical protein
MGLSVAWLMLFAAFVSTLIVSVRRGRRVNRLTADRRHVGIQIRLHAAGPLRGSLSTAADLVRIDCDQLGMVYRFGTGELDRSPRTIPGSLGVGPEHLPSRSAAGWMTLETLPTAAGLVLLQCRPAGVAYAVADE